MDRNLPAQDSGDEIAAEKTLENIEIRLGLLLRTRTYSSIVTML